MFWFWFGVALWTVYGVIFGTVLLAGLLQGKKMKFKIGDNVSIKDNNGQPLGEGEVTTTIQNNDGEFYHVKTNHMLHRNVPADRVEMTPVFKVGELVVVKSAHMKGNIGTIDSYASNNTRYNIKIGSDVYTYYRAEDLEKAPSVDFAVGDWVEIVLDDSFCHIKGKIAHNYGSAFSVNIGEDYMPRYYASALQKIKQPIGADVVSLMEGDQVQIIGHNTYEGKSGTITKITKRQGGSNIYSVDLKAEGGIVNYNRGALRKLLPPKFQEAAPKSQNPPYEITKPKPLPLKNVESLPVVQFKGCGIDEEWLKKIATQFKIVPANEFGDIPNYSLLDRLSWLEVRQCKVWVPEKEYVHYGSKVFFGEASLVWVRGKDAVYITITPTKQSQIRNVHLVSYGTNLKFESKLTTRTADGLPVVKFEKGKINKEFLQALFEEAEEINNITAISMTPMWSRYSPLKRLRKIRVWVPQSEAIRGDGCGTHSANQRAWGNMDLYFVSSSYYNGSWGYHFYVNDKTEQDYAANVPFNTCVELKT